MVGLSGCMRADERNFSGIAQGEFSLHFELAMSFDSDNKVKYELKIIPNNPNEFFSHLNKKWHDEARLKFSAYDKLKEYCNQYKDAALCFNYNELNKEVESKDVDVFYTVKIYNRSKKELDNISGKFSFNLNNKDILKDSWVNAAGRVTMTQSQFREIASVELQIQ